MEHQGKVKFALEKHQEHFGQRVLKYWGCLLCSELVWALTALVLMVLKWIYCSSCRYSYCQILIFDKAWLIKFIFFLFGNSYIWTHELRHATCRLWDWNGRFLLAKTDVELLNALHMLVHYYFVCVNLSSVAWVCEKTRVKRSINYTSRGPLTHIPFLLVYFCSGSSLTSLLHFFPQRRWRNHAPLIKQQPE